MAHQRDELDLASVLDIWKGCRRAPSGASLHPEPLEPPESKFVADTLDKESGTRFFADSFYPLRLQGDPQGIFGKPSRQDALSSTCYRFYNAVLDEKDHFNRIDGILSSLLKVEVVTTENDYEVANRTFCLLSRLSENPPEPGNVPDNLHRSIDDLGPYCILSRQSGSATQWEDLQVVARPSTNLVLTALNYTCRDGCHFADRDRDVYSSMRYFYWDMENLEVYVNVLSELLERTLQLSQEATMDHKMYWYLVVAFLWCSWQRSVTLLIWFNLERQLEWGLDFNRTQTINLRKCPLSTKIGPGLYADYMCRWAYKMLCSDTLAPYVDLRHFHLCYRKLNDSKIARCNNGIPCDGTSPTKCKRFVGALVKNQSAHNYTCPSNCQRLVWDEKSYKRVKGAIAVCINSTSDRIRYCQASTNTFAISHVWSHGQGGRPEDVTVNGQDGGMNSCLHTRYSELAKGLQCDSYWMDTPCIPEEHNLRAEAIGNINKIFRQSKATLIVDKDLIDIDVSNLSLRVKEYILATILVCDWNVRSWTYLEALFGRKNILLLCKNNRTVSLRDILHDVHQKGSIDLVALFQTAPQLLPPPKADTELYFPARLQSDWVAEGFISRETAAVALCNRRASRPGDDILIWSLLSGEKNYTSPIELWKIRPELNRPAAGDLVDVVYEPELAGASNMGYIEDEGLRSSWAVHIIDPLDGKPNVGYRNKILTLAMDIGGSVRQFCSVALLQPLWNRTMQAYRYRGNATAPLFGVVASINNSNWEWIGVYEWDLNESLPPFEIKMMLLV